MTDWPEHDTARCMNEGEHIGSQRHPRSDCPAEEAHGPWETGTKVAEVALDGGGFARLNDVGPGAYVLCWTDGVANDWVEQYGDLSTALARLAALVACGNGERWFRQQDAVEFTPVWLAALDSMATPADGAPTEPQGRHAR
jgi:hypothetical protein